LHAKAEAARQRGPGSVQPIAKPNREPPLHAPRHGNVDGKDGEAQRNHP